MENLELFNDDFHLVDVINEGNKLQREVEEVRNRLIGVLTKEEIESLRELTMKLSPGELARMECNHILLALIK